MGGVRAWAWGGRDGGREVQVDAHCRCLSHFIGSGQGPVRDFGTERALVEPLGPNTTNFPS